MGIRLCGGCGGQYGESGGGALIRVMAFIDLFFCLLFIRSGQAKNKQKERYALFGKLSINQSIITIEYYLISPSSLLQPK